LIPVTLALFSSLAWAQTPAPVPGPMVPGPMAQGTRAALILVDQTDLAPAEEQALRGLAETELNAHGFSLVQDPALNLRGPVDADTVQAARAEGAQRVFVLEARGRLGVKIPMTMEEIGPDGNFIPGSISSLTTEIEEADTVIPRLVRGTLGRQTGASTAEIDSVTYAEAKPFQKKPGEKFFMIGVGIPLYKGNGSSAIFGYSVAFFYEADVWRVGGTVEGGGHNDLTEVFTGLEGAWIPLKGEFSPYIGGGIGFEGTTGDSGVGAKLAVGVEAFRLHGVRAMAGFDFHIPFFNDGHQNIYPSLGIRFAF
jgi:hypothetical protein